MRGLFCAVAAVSAVTASFPLRLEIISPFADGPVLVQLTPGCFFASIAMAPMDPPLRVVQAEEMSLVSSPFLPNHAQRCIPSIPITPWQSDFPLPIFLCPPLRARLSPYSCDLGLFGAAIPRRRAFYSRCRVRESDASLSSLRISPWSLRAGL